MNFYWCLVIIFWRTKNFGKVRTGLYFNCQKNGNLCTQIRNRDLFNDHVIFLQVKTTSPKKYCVRPNIGVIKPKSTYDFTGICILYVHGWHLFLFMFIYMVIHVTFFSSCVLYFFYFDDVLWLISNFCYAVTMQAQKSAPSDMQCKDKFLVQSTVAPFGTTEEDITPDLVSACSLNQILFSDCFSYYFPLVVCKR